MLGVGSQGQGGWHSGGMPSLVWGGTGPSQLEGPVASPTQLSCCLDGKPSVEMYKSVCSEIRLCKGCGTETTKFSIC